MRDLRNLSHAARVLFAGVSVGCGWNTSEMVAGTCWEGRGHISASYIGKISVRV